MDWSKYYPANWTAVTAEDVRMIREKKLAPVDKDAVKQDWKDRSDDDHVDIDKAMLSDSVSTVAGAMMGTSTVTTYVESAAGVKAGGRTGMASLVIGILFLLCLFFSPLATSLPKEIDGAALIYIATLFVRNIVDIEWDDIAESGPAVLAMIAMPFTYSISHGIALAFISYAAIKICTGKTNVSPAIWVIAVASVISFVVA